MGPGAAGEPLVLDGLSSPRTLESLLESPTRSIVGLVDALVKEARARRASDIHIIPSKDGLRIRMRIDGILEDAALLPSSFHGEVISRVKVLARLRTDEHQAAQDGRFRHAPEDADASPFDVRVSIAPTYYGENAVLRLLIETNEAFTLEGLGFSSVDSSRIRKSLSRSSGMLLATGPTGSGKTTTLYTLLRMLSSPGVSIVTIEDPIEYAIEGVTQIPIQARSGLTFANGLRSIVRQDPDIIMVGEIRDAETAGIAVNTALTGHLLLSTVHTASAAMTLPRLSDMGIDSYLVASTMTLAVGQRLVRRICAGCREPLPVSKDMETSLADLALSDPLREGDTVYRGRGCEACAGSGYQGRTTINEVLVADRPMREAILRRAPAHELESVAVEGGMTTMREDGFSKVRDGITTVEEALRVAYV